MIRALWRIALTLWLVACGPIKHIPASPSQEVRYDGAPIFSDYAWCDDSESYLACKMDDQCAAGYKCVDGWCQPIWEGDCQPRCIPKTHPKVLCHGNFEAHGIGTEQDIKWMSVLEPVEAIGDKCGGPAWRIWGVKLDDRPRDYLDSVSLSTWYSPTTLCSTLRPEHFESNKFFEENPDLDVYLLMWPGYGGAIGLLDPPQ